MTNLYVTVPLDAGTLRKAEEREWRERQAGSCVVSVTRTSAAQLRREAFWREIEQKQQRRVTPFRPEG